MARQLLRLPFFVTLIAIVALSMLIPSAHAAVLRDWPVARAFLHASLLILLVFGMLAAVLRDTRSNRPPRALLVAVIGAYTVLPALLALPFYEALGTTRFTLAWFEMVSSFTTTGATVYDPGRLPPTLHLWRAQVGWMGGFLILVTAVGIFAPLNLGGFEVISEDEAGAGSTATQQITRIADGGERMLRFAGILAPVYCGLTLALWILLSLTGTPPLQAICHAMSTLATSGISPTEGAAHSPAEELLIFGFLMLSLSRRVFVRDTFGTPLPVWKNREIRVAAVAVGAVTVLIFLKHWTGASVFDDQDDLAAGVSALWGSLFTALSFLTTTGFESASWSAAQDWSGLQTTGLALAGLALFGGGVATTAGGVKLLRIYALYAHGKREIERLIHPNSVGGSGMIARRIRRKGAQIAWVVFMLMAVSIAAVMAALALMGVPFEAAMVLTIAALTTTGPLAHAALQDPVPLATLSEAARGVLAAAMVVGRLETLAFIAVLNPDFWRR